jgi:hypothetical protein
VLIVPLPFLACVSSGVRRPLTFSPVQPTFRPLRQTTSSFLHSPRHSAIRSSIFSNLSQHFRSSPGPSLMSPIFVLFSRSFHLPDFSNSFLDHDRPSTGSPIHSSMFVVITWPHSAFQSPPFLNKLVFNRVNIPHLAIDFLNVSFLARSWLGSTNVSHSEFLNALSRQELTEFSCS